MPARQSAQSILMVSPASFGFDEETAASNTFQVRPGVSPSKTTELAVVEFREAVKTLEKAGISIVVHEGDPNENKPDAVFPNNWLSTWPGGTIYMYPMAATNRRAERDQRVLDQLAAKFELGNVIDISASEATDQYLESTGAIVFDHLEKIAYGCLSDRCDRQIFTQHADDLGYQPAVFEAFDQSGKPIYHTNVMMGIQSSTAVICSSAITNPDQRRRVLAALGRNRQVVDITQEQMAAFCGNVLEVENIYGKKILVMSESAFNAFTKDQLAVLSTDKTIIPISIPTIEEAGGGSARCMLAEIFLPLKN